MAVTNGDGHDIVAVGDCIIQVYKVVTDTSHYVVFG
jgi:hypothetical protein